MKTLFALWAVLLTLLAAPSVYAANTHGDPNVAKEMQAWFGDTTSPAVVSGCVPAVPGASLTLAAFACEASARDSTGGLIYMNQASAAVGPLSGGNGTYWLLMHQDTTSAVAGWTRQRGTHYLWQLSTLEPATPVGSLIVSQVTVAAGAISAVNPVFPTRGAGCLSLADYSGDYAQRVNAALVDVPTKGTCIDARMMRGNRSSATTIALAKQVRLLFPASTWTYTGSGCVIDLQVGANNVVLQGMGRRDSILRASGTAGAERGLCTTVAGGTSVNRGTGLVVRDLQFQGSGNATTPGTVGTVGVYVDSFEHARFEGIDVWNWGVGVQVRNVGTAYHNLFLHLGVYYNLTYGYQFLDEANSHLVLGGRSAGNGTNFHAAALTNLVVSGVTFEHGGGVTTKHMTLDGTQRSVIRDNRFEGGVSCAPCTIEILNEASGNLLSGNYPASGHGDPVEDTSTYNSTHNLDTWSTSDPGTGTQGRSAPPSPVGVQDLVSNGSFEFDLANSGLATNWTEISTPGAGHAFSVNAGGKCGTRYQRLDNTGDANARLAQDVPVDLGRPYVVSYFGFKNGDDGNIGVKMGTTGNENAYANIKTQKTDSGWRHTYGIVTPTTTPLRITLFHAGSAAVVAGWDCLSVTPGLWAPQYEEPRKFAATINLVTNPATQLLNAGTVTPVSYNNLIGLLVGDRVHLAHLVSPAQGVAHNNWAIQGGLIPSTSTLTVLFINPNGSATTLTPGAGTPIQAHLTVFRQRP